MNRPDDPKRKFFKDFSRDARAAMLGDSRDKDGDGIPDFMQTGDDVPESLNTSVTTTRDGSGREWTVLRVNGVTYHSVDQIPREVLDKLRRAGVAIPELGTSGPRRAEPQRPMGPTRRPTPPGPSGNRPAPPPGPRPVPPEVEAEDRSPGTAPPEPLSLSSIEQSELTRQLLGEAPPSKWWQFWKH